MTIRIAPVDSALLRVSWRGSIGYGGRRQDWRCGPDYGADADALGYAAQCTLHAWRLRPRRSMQTVGAARQARVMVTDGGDHGDYQTRVIGLGKSLSISLMVDDFSAWVGRSIEADDLVTAAPVRRLAATLDHDGGHWPADVLPPLGHWLFHLPDALRSALAPDGHPATGGLLPPISQPRRMWAGGRLRFERAIPFGAIATKRSTVAAVVAKGAMTFVTLRHDLIVNDTVAVSEEQDIVYLPVAAPAPPKPADRPPPAHSRAMVADEALLFRFSALTFNAHRIHYDLRYGRDVELYPALVVHGPLQAMLLADEAQRVGETVSRFDFRGRAPLYAGKGFTIARAGADWWIRDDDGIVTMTATIA